MYQSSFELGYVALNVRNLDLQSQYYQQVLGLSVIHQDETMIDSFSSIDSNGRITRYCW